MQAGRGLHINVLELLAIFQGLSAYCLGSKNVHVKVMCDNTTAVAYINAMGGSQSLLCNKLSRKIWLCCMGEISGCHAVTCRVDLTLKLINSLGSRG